MNKFVELKICNYIDDTLDVEREVKFKITKECLQDYLTETEDGRTINKFLKRTIVMNQVLFMNMRVMMVEFYQKKLHIVMILMNSTKTLSEERKCLILI